MIELAKAMLIKADGTVATHYFGGKMPTLKEMQNLVGGNIELVRFSNSETMVVDEEGMQKHKPVNAAAISFLSRNNLAGSFIVGDVFVISNKFLN